MSLNKSFLKGEGFTIKILLDHRHGYSRPVIRFVFKDEEVPPWLDPPTILITRYAGKFFGR